MPTFPKDAKTSFFHRLYPRKNKQLPPSQKTGETAAFPRRFFCNITLFHKKNTIMKRASESFPPSASCLAVLPPASFWICPCFSPESGTLPFFLRRKQENRRKKGKTLLLPCRTKGKCRRKKCVALPARAESTDTARTQHGHGEDRGKHGMQMQRQE